MSRPAHYRPAIVKNFLDEHHAMQLTLSSNRFKLYKNLNSFKKPIAAIKIYPENNSRTSLVVQWMGVHLPMQETQVGSLVQEDSTCHRATQPVNHNY